MTLDVGNTLLFPEPSVGWVYAKAASTYGVNIAADEAEWRFAAAWRDTERAQSGLVYGTSHAEALDFWLCVVRKCFMPDGVDDDIARCLCRHLYDSFGRADVWRVNPGWPRVREHCLANGIRMGLISNWDLRLRPLLHELGLAEEVDSVVISAEHGVEKPDARIFHVACSELAVGPMDVLHVGDTWDADVKAARDIGMRAAWFNPSGEAVPDAAADVQQLSDLAELVPLLGGCLA